MEASQLELADSGWRFPEGLPGSVAAGHVAAGRAAQAERVSQQKFRGRQSASTLTSICWYIYSPHRGAGLTIPTRCDQYPKGVGVLPEALAELFRRLLRSYLSTYFLPEPDPEPDPGWDGSGLGFGTGCASISAWPQKLVMSFAFPRSNRLTSGGTLLPLRN